ncbi:MAG: 5-formyltetrahydrofolate cyclo-ligase [Gallionella sp.]|nr:5-formyltetrahydrofolate cyclo-ligase [Gallionella sp.]
MTLASEKQQIRKSILAAREQLLQETRTAYNVTITERLLQLPEYQQAGIVLGYMNFGSEFASDLWVKQVLTDGKRLLLPKVNHHTNQLDLYWVDDPESQLAAGLWKIREPVVECCKRLNDINEVEFALLPGVAFSRDGARLGYGGGYYDKLLAQMTHRPTLVCAAFGLQIVAQIPQEETDIKTAWIVTEAETIDCSVTGNT